VCRLSSLQIPHHSTHANYGFFPVSSCMAANMDVLDQARPGHFLLHSLMCSQPVSLSIGDAGCEIPRLYYCHTSQLQLV